MKHISIFSLLLLLFTTTGTNCKKGGLFAEKLPAATQEGKNTCGFLVNGTVWLPKGDNGFANLACEYDETFMGGAFNITGYRYEPNKRSTFAVSGRDITGTGVYKLNISANQKTYFSTDNNSIFCIYEWSDTIPGHNAFLNITKLDKQRRIVSGVFEFALVNPSCEEIRVTQGRFDMKY